MYKLPDYEANYVLFHNKEVSVTGFVGKISEDQQEQLERFVEQHGQQNNKLAAADNLVPVMDGYFFDQYLISVNDKKMLVDIKEDLVTVDEGCDETFSVSFKDTFSTMKHFTKQACKAMDITFASQTHGNVTVTIELYANPQIHNGIRISMDKNIRQGVGLLLRNYKPRLMQIARLDKVPSKLLKTLKKHKNPYTTKSIVAKDEVWIESENDKANILLR